MRKTCGEVHSSGMGVPLTSMAAVANGAVPSMTATGVVEVKLFPPLLVMAKALASEAVIWVLR